jgi:hypothetical protein
LTTFGDVPIEWYEDYDHLGYDLLGKKIAKPKSEGEIDKLLAREATPWYVSRHSVLKLCFPAISFFLFYLFFFILIQNFHLFLLRFHDIGFLIYI